MQTIYHTDTVINQKKNNNMFVDDAGLDDKTADEFILFVI